MRLLNIALASILVGCGVGASAPTVEPLPAKGDAPSPAAEGRAGWSADDSYELAAVIRSTISRAAVGPWAGLATDVDLQHQLVDLQLKYARNTLAARPFEYVLDQLAREVTIDGVSVTDDVVTLSYSAAVDLLRRGDPQALPTLAELPATSIAAVVPRDPVDVYRAGWQDRLGEDCADDWGDYTLAEHKYYYYFAPHKPGCRERMEALGIYQLAQVEIVEVYPAGAVYPEYDRLAKVLDPQTGTVGFSAAIVPHTGDDDPASRFDAHQRKLDALGLVGTPQDGGRYLRYLWDAPGVQLTIDLYDPTAVSWPDTFSSQFHELLGAYQLVQYNGHSNYGAKDLLADATAFMDDYQIVVMHSCSSYAYYAQQVFRAKASDDPLASEDQRRGWADADVLATGQSSYPSDSPIVMAILLRGLVDGLAAIQAGAPQDAPSWQDLTREMNRSTWGRILYGVAGSRTNAWQP